VDGLAILPIGVGDGGVERVRGFVGDGRGGGKYGDEAQNRANQAQTTHP
jgi:hypothetical protein